MEIRCVVLLVLVTLHAVICQEVDNGDMQKLSTNDTVPDTAKSCDDVYTSGKRTTGAYNINPDPTCSSSGPFTVRCDMDTSCNGWTVIQRRYSTSLGFSRTWTDYVNGFYSGSCGNSELWLGLEKIHRLTSVGNWYLRIELEDFHGNSTYATYSDFAISSKSSYYKLYYSWYSGLAGDVLSWNKNMPFSTYDSNHGSYKYNCAGKYSGGWWYNTASNCGQQSNINGVYAAPCKSPSARDMRWDTWIPYNIPGHAIKKSQMMISRMPVSDEEQWN